MEIYAASHLVPVSSPPVSGGAILVDSGRIVATGSVAELRAKHNAAVRDFPCCAIVPGLVNAHTHLELTHFPSWKIRKGIDYAPRTYVDWIIQVIKIRRALTLQELELSVREGIRICLESGTTSVGEVLSDRSLLPLYAAASLAGRVYFEAIGHDPVRCLESLTALRHDLTTFAHGSLKPGLSPHAPHTLSARFHGEIMGLAKDLGIPRLIHLAESREEIDFFFDTSGKIAELLYPHVRWEEYLPPPQRATSTAWLNRLGLLDGNTTAVHGVQLTPSDAEILSSRDVGMVLCPRSNEKLAVGKAPAHLLKKLGILIALGTDSLASNDSLSLWDEMRFASATAYPDVFTPAEILAMATLNAAQVMKVESEVGSLEAGKRADFLVVPLPGPVAQSELYEAIIHGGDRCDVYVAGRPLTNNRLK